MRCIREIGDELTDDKDEIVCTWIVLYYPCIDEKSLVVRRSGKRGNLDHKKQPSVP